jgi:hypothetical protein
LPEPKTVAPWLPLIDVEKFQAGRGRAALPNPEIMQLTNKSDNERGSRKRKAFMIEVSG